MLIPEHKIEEIRERVDIVAVVSRYVELKKAGRSFKGRCPFHQEKSASFHVTPDLKRFKCFGCQAGGDAISFVQRYLGKTFLDALKDLAREAGVDLAAAEDPAAKERAQLREATDLAAERWKQNLWDDAKGEIPRRYLEKRGVTAETAKAFGLGFSLPSWNDLTDAITSHGIIEWGQNAGLIGKRTRTDGYYDVFRARLMVPIRSPEGRVIAFGGRILEEALDPKEAERAGAKYLNSKESRLYNKSDVLYGTDQAREDIRKTKTAILVEGYFDCIGLHQAGVKNAVALCSTALTPGHLALLKRLDAQNLVLLLDGDEAGRKAVERLGGPLLAQGVATKVALLPEGEDPDTFAQREGEAGVQGLLKGARPLTEHLFLAVLPQGKDASFEQKMQGLERIRPIVASLPVGLTRSAFISAMSLHFGLPAAELEAELRGKAPPPVRAVPKPGQSPVLNTGRGGPGGPGGPASNAGRGGQGPGSQRGYGDGRASEDAGPGGGYSRRNAPPEGQRGPGGYGHGGGGNAAPGSWQKRTGGEGQGGGGYGQQREYRSRGTRQEDPGAALAAFLGQKPKGKYRGKDDGGGGGFGGGGGGFEGKRRFGEPSPFEGLEPPPHVDDDAYGPPPMDDGGGFSDPGNFGSDAPVRAAPRPPAERPPDRLEALYGAFALRDLRLLGRDTRRVSDELSHTGLRFLVGQISSGTKPEDAVAESSLPLQTALEKAGRELPQEDTEVAPAFDHLCRDLKLRRINEQLSHIAKEAGKVAGASDLTQETLSLMEERVRLLELKRQLLEEKERPVVGTKPPSGSV